MNIRTAIIIPARLASTRFPAKLIRPIHGIPLVEHVYLICVESGLDTYIATEDTDIAELFPYNVIRASGNNGTERCMNAAKKLDYDFFINVQGDFVGVTADVITGVRQMLIEHSGAIVTAHTDNPAPNDVNIILQEFSDPAQATWFTRAQVSYGYKHLGIYGFSKTNLMDYNQHFPSEAEKAEHLEQMRWMDMGVPMLSVEAENMAVSDINTPDDLEAYNDT